MNFYEWFAGVEHIWLAWLVGVVLLVHGAIRLARHLRQPIVREVLAQEEGVSWTLGYVLVVPFYLFFMCIVFESSLLLLAKIGTLYSAHAAARSAIVWESASPPHLREQRIQQSTFTAMAPYVSARARDIDQGKIPASAYAQADDFIEAYQSYSANSMNQNDAKPQRWARSNAPPDYLRRKYLNAASRTTYQVISQPREPGSPTTVIVTYRAPLVIPGVTRFLLQGGREASITSQATLPNETPVSDSRDLGIEYHSR